MKVIFLRDLSLSVLTNRKDFGALMTGINPVIPNAGAYEQVLNNVVLEGQKRRASLLTYAGPETADDAWCTKENAVNYNSSLTWLATAANTLLPDLLSGVSHEPQSEPEPQGEAVFSITSSRHSEWTSNEPQFGGGGYCQVYSITNDGTAAGDFEFTFSPSNGGTIHSHWGFLMGGERNSGRYIARSTDWTSNVQPGETVSSDVGWCVMYGSGIPPTPEHHYDF